jgi:HSP20 family molecular chaperone IbpA
MTRNTELTPFKGFDADRTFKSLENALVNDLGFGKLFPRPWWEDPRFTDLDDVLRNDGAKFFRNEDKSVDVQISLPGAKKDEVKVSSSEPHTITVSVDESSDKKDHAYHKSYRQIFTVDDDLDVDSLTARLEDGLLKVHLPHKDVTDDENVKVFDVQ